MQQDLRAQVDIFRNRDVQIGAAVGLIVGLLLGWFVLGWWIAPVQWVDARPGDLHPRWQDHYIAMVVDSYVLTGDRQTAEARLEGFDRETLGHVFGRVEAELEAAGAIRQAEGLRQLADQLDVSLVVPEVPAVATTTAPTPAAEAEATAARSSLAILGGSRLAQVCGIVILTFLIVVAGVAGLVWYRNRPAPFGARKETPQGVGLPRDKQRIGSINLGGRATVEYNDEGPGYEETIQIYRGDDIIGSCGLRSVTTLSDGEHVVACAAWLYEPRAPERSADTRVLTSRRVYQNTALRNAVAHDREPGEVLPAESGQTAHLEHETLEMTLRVLEVEYADPDEQYISRLIVEMEPVARPENGK